jgi:hypothetical protein
MPALLLAAALIVPGPPVTTIVQAELQGYAKPARHPPVRDRVRHRRVSAVLYRHWVFTDRLVTDGMGGDASGCGSRCRAAARLDDAGDRELCRFRGATVVVNLARSAPLSIMRAGRAAGRLSR